MKIFLVRYNIYVSSYSYLNTGFHSYNLIAEVFMHVYVFVLRAYGVVVWEILMFGQLPLPNKDTQDIVKAAQNKKLEHSK